MDDLKTPMITLTLGQRFGGEYQPEDQPLVREILSEYLNVTTGDLLIAGASYGFDAAVADVVMAEGCEADTILIAPFTNFYAHWADKSEPRQTFERLLDTGLRTIYAAEGYYGGVYTNRDRLALRTALDAAEQAPFTTRLRALTFWDGSRGALQDSLLDLLAMGVEVHNLMPEFIRRRKGVSDDAQH